MGKSSKYIETVSMLIQITHMNTVLKRTLKSTTSNFTKILFLQAVFSANQVASLRLINWMTNVKTEISSHNLNRAVVLKMRVKMK